MPSITDWLSGMGLEKYASAFESAEIDVETLPDLLESDLEDLGLPLGPRRKVWAAIRRMDATNDRGGIEKDDASPLPEGPFFTPVAQQPERRHLTVMFIDLVGSTEMAGRMDAEDMREVFTRYQDCITTVVTEHNGFVATFMGDGVLCYFGWPVANEDDTERAVRAGLAIIDEVGRIATPDGAALAVRVGVATGIVVVGDLVGDGARQQTSVVGETPNLAARLQSIAEPNQLIVPDDALPLLGSVFELMPLGSKTFKGVTRQIKSFVVRGEAVSDSRFAARRAGTLTPIVGRDAELSSIMACWEEARSGSGRLVVVSGEAGIGKSRLTQAVIDKVKAGGDRYTIYQCSPNHTESAFYPIIRPIIRWARVETGHTSDKKLDKIEALVEGNKQSAALLAQLLSIDCSDRYAPSDATPTQQRSQLIRLLVTFMCEQARETPMLIVFEDLHWIDPTSLELLQAAFAEIPEQKILLLATTRGAVELDFPDVTKVTRLTLERLDTRMVGEFVFNLTEGKKLPPEILQVITDRTDGVPLFIEELTKSILESGALKESGDTYLVDTAFQNSAIPATLHDSLLARLDRLNETKEIAQIAACIGRDFSHHLMARVCDISYDALEDALTQLVASELIHRIADPPRTRYQFKHALVRDAAYESLLKSRRRDIHKRILTALDSNTDVAPELLATHAEAAGLTAQAIVLWETAAKAAIARPAYQECEAHLKRAIGLNAAQASAGDREALEKAISLHVQLFVAQSPGTGFWADETIATLEEALSLADKLGETPLRGDIVYGLVLSTYFRGSLERSIASADELNLLAQASGDDAQLLVAKRLAGVGRLMGGQLLHAAPYLDQAEDLCDRVADQNLAARFGHDPIVGVYIYQSMLNTFRGRNSTAQDYRKKAEERARRVAHTNTSCTMYGLALFCAHIAGNIAAERRHLTNMRLLIEEHAVTASHLWAEVAVALLKLGDGQESAIEEYWQTEKAMLDANIRLLVPGNRVMAARRIKALGHPEEAHKMANAAEALMTQTGEKSWLPELYRLRASFALDHGDVALAEQHLKGATSIARTAGTTLWETRALLDLARLYNSTGRASDALSLLASLKRSIAEGDCPAEQKEAADLIRDLGPAA